MPIKYKIFQDKKLVYALGIDEITCQDLLLHFEELAANPEYLPPMKKLVDYRNSTLSHLSIEESIKVTRKKAQLIEKFKGEKCAFVTKSDLDYGMSRFHETHLQIEGSDITTSVFRNFEDALAWLKVNLKEPVSGMIHGGLNEYRTLSNQGGFRDENAGDQRDGKKERGQGREDGQD